MSRIKFETKSSEIWMKMEVTVKLIAICSRPLTYELKSNDRKVEREKRGICSHTRVR